MELAPFYFDHEGCFLLPLEHLSPRGMSSELRAEVLARGLLPEPSADLFDAAVALAFDRLGALHRAAPDSHLPPRLTNVMVVRDAETTRPYFQPFVQMCSVVYATDLDPAQSSAEHAAFQLLVAERLGQLRRYGLALLASLPLLLSLTPEQAAGFTRGACLSERPDRATSHRLAELLPSLRANLVAEGAGLEGEPPEGYGRVRGTTLAALRTFAPELAALGKLAEGAATSVACAYLERQAAASGRHEDEAVARLERERPLVLVTAESGEILWDPERPAEVAALRAALEGIGRLPAESLGRDLATVDRATRRFLGLLRDPDALVVPVQSLEEAGGVFIHHTRRLVAYSLVQPGLDVRREAAPPFHRLLLAARVTHEWGHLAVDAGVVRVPAHRRQELQSLGRELHALLTRIAESVPDSATELVRAELAELERDGVRVEELPLARIEDYQSNLLARRILAPEELEAYIRANVRSLVAEPIGLLRKLTRYAYEAQYLWLSKMRDPWAYFTTGTWVLEEMVEGELASEAALRELVSLVGRVAATYEIDESKLRA